MPGEIRIGISGWRYEPWRGTFYPEDLTQKKELWYASRQLNSIEINGSFYSLQRPTSWKQWYEQTPEDFVFSVKGNRFITHIRRLRDVEKPVANFFAQGILALGEKLGPILWQFPPNFKYERERVEEFFAMLPRNMDGPIRHAMEVRHASFETAEFVELLRKHDVALVVADTAGKWPFFEDLTSDFVYARLHGDEKIYASGYTPKALDKWAGRVKAWLKGGEVGDAVHVSEKKSRKLKKRDVFVYFDNDLKVRAPFDAMGLSQRVGGYLPEVLPGPPGNLPKEARESWPVMNY